MWWQKQNKQRKVGNCITQEMVLKYMFVIFGLLISFNVNAEELTSELKAEEGYKQCAYNDSNGNPTIGYGECIAAKCGGKDKINQVLKRKVGNCITQEEANLLLHHSIKKSKNHVTNMLDDVNLTASQRNALTKLTFIGGSLGKFRSIVKHLKNGNGALAKNAFLTHRVCKQIGRRRCNVIANSLNE